MSSQEVTQLRKAGRLEEAEQLALQLLQTEPENIWNKRAMAWVLYDLVKMHQENGDVAKIIETYQRIAALELPADESMFFDQCAWQVGKLVFALHKQLEFPDPNQISEVFHAIRAFHFPKSVDSYSVLFLAFLKWSDIWTEFQAFADWWNFENFQAKDFENEIYNGKSMPSTIERAGIAYAKKLLEGEPAGALPEERRINRDKIAQFILWLDPIIEQYPQFVYLPYYKAKLLIATGSEEDALAVFRPFAKQKRNDFWVWELIAEMHPHDPDIQFSCYCKALSLGAQEDYLVKLRQTFANLLITKKMYNEARTEIQALVDTRNRHGWKIPASVLQWTDEPWYKMAVALKNNHDLYAAHVASAEEILFADITEELIVIEFVNEVKRSCNFIQHKERQGFFKYPHAMGKPKVGDIFMVRFAKGNAVDGYQKVLTTRRMPVNTPHEAIKNYQGVLKIKQQANIGFVDDIFIDPSLLKATNLPDASEVKGRAMLSFNKKREEWGWKAIDIAKRV
jgi:hypothetical protein